MSGLALEIDDGPVSLSLFEMFEPQSNCLVPAQTSSNQQRKKSAISLALELFAVWRLPECDALLNSQPVAQPHAEIPDTFDAANPSSKIGAQQNRICCLIGEPPHHPQAQVDSFGGKKQGFEVGTIARIRVDRRRWSGCLTLLFSRIRDLANASEFWDACAPMASSP